MAVTIAVISQLGRLHSSLLYYVMYFATRPNSNIRELCASKVLITLQNNSMGLKTYLDDGVANSFQEINQFFKRSGEFAGDAGSTPSSKCDGQDEMGCYQVRLYYDWFLIPGSCKCWKNDFFEQYTKRRK